ncbi:MAG: glycosyltransferase [Candidatus Marinimicrobia bacterium]|nr:glycosyltransferase [Candidatus Neomarinimicrobiota bacterium]
MLVYILLVFGLLMNILLKLPFINIPLDRDYGVYGYHALFKLKKKKIPYIDTGENHPPGRWLLYLLLIRLFGISRKVFRISNIVFHLLTNLLVFLVAGELFGDTVAIISSFSYAFISSLPAYVWTQSSDEVEQIFFTSLSFYLFILGAQAQNYYLLLISGISSMGALFFKQTAYLNTILPLCISGLIYNFRFSGYISIIFGMIIGFIGIFLFFKYNNIPTDHFRIIFGFKFKFLKKQLELLFYHTKELKKEESEPATHAVLQNDQKKTFNFKYTKEGYLRWVKVVMVPILKNSSIYILFALSGIVLGIVYSHNINSLLFTLVWLVGAILGIIINKHYMAYHFLPLLGPILILSGFGASELWKMLSTNGSILAIAIITILIVGYFGIILIDFNKWRKIERKGRGHIFYYRQEWEMNLAGEKIGRMLKDITNEDDKIYVWGPEYEIYLFSERPSPTTTLFCPRPYISYSPDPYGMETMIVNQLSNDKPKYIVITALTEGFENFENFLKENYSLYAKKFGELSIYKKKEEEMENVIKLNTNISAPPKVSVITLTFNGIEYTKMFFKYLLKNTSGSYEVIVVDNGSSDGTREYLDYLSNNYSHVKVILNNTNVGFSKGANQGLSFANGKYLMVINNDVLVPPEWLEKMIKPFEIDESIGLVGPLTNWISGLQMVENVQYENPEDFEEYAMRISEARKYKYTPRRRIAGFAMMINRRLYDAIGGFDENFVGGNYEDDDYCLRASKAGFKIVVAENVFMHHYGSATFKSNKINYEKSIEMNKEIFKKKWQDIDFEWLMERDKRLVDLSEDQINVAVDLFTQSRYQDAREIFVKVLSYDPLNEEALFGLALCYRNVDDNLNAIRMLKKCIDLNPDNAYAYNQSGIISAELGDFESAKALFAAAVAKAPDFVDAQRNYAEVLLELEQYEDGVRAFVKILENHPNDVLTLLRMAELYQEVGRYDEAKQFASKVLEYDPTNVKAIEILELQSN